MAFFSREVDPNRVAAGAIVGLLLAFITLVVGWQRWQRWQTYEAPVWGSLRPEMSREQVVSLMGEPVTRFDNAGLELPPHSDSSPTEPVSGQSSAANEREVWWYFDQNRRVVLSFDAQGLQSRSVDGLRGKGDPFHHDYRAQEVR